MKEQLVNLGHLVALKELNRDSLAEELGTTRQNLIAALKGRRPLPKQYYAPLFRALNLGDDELLQRNNVHILTISNLEKQFNFFEQVLFTFTLHPLTQVALLHGIGEKNNTLVYILQDKRGVYLVIRGENLITDTKNTDSAFCKKIFDTTTYSLEREIPILYFERLMREGISEKDIENILSTEGKVWTWSRISEKARSLGLSPEEIAKNLNFV